MQTKRLRHNRKPKRLAPASRPNLNRSIVHRLIILPEPLPEMPRSPTTSATRRRCEDTSTNGTTDIGGDGISAPSFSSEADITIGMRGIGIRPGDMILLITTTTTTAQSILTVIF